MQSSQKGYIVRARYTELSSWAVFARIEFGAESRFFNRVSAPNLLRYAQSA